MVKAPNLDHLSPSAAKLAMEDDEVRIDRILADRWIGYTRANAGLEKLEWLLRHPKRTRMPNLLIVGPTNNGKTMITEKFRRDHSAGVSRETGAETIPVLRVQSPDAADPRRFYNAVLNALNAPDRPGDLLAKKESQALHLLRATGVRVLIIDEIHNLLAGQHSKMGQMLNMLRYLGNELQIPLVAVGVKEALTVIHSDDQLANRFEPFPLPRWDDGEETVALLESFQYVLPLRRPSTLTSPPMMRKIVALSEGILGEMATLVTRAAELAVREGAERIELKTFDRIDYHSPSQRRASAAIMKVD